MSAFRLAADLRIPFGRYTGNTLDEIAKTDEGLIYLDWLRGCMDDDRKAKVLPQYNQPVLDALAAYLDDPTIAKELEKAMRE